MKDVSIVTRGTTKLVADMDIRIDFFGADGKKFHLHLWKPDGKGGRTGSKFPHPQALRSYAEGLLEMCNRFEAVVRPEWEARGGNWLTPEEMLSAATEKGAQ